MFWRDVRYAARALARSPLYALATIATLALGVGVNAAMFAVAKGVLLESLPYPEPERLVRPYFSNPDLGLPLMPFSALDYRDVRDQSRAFSAFAAVRPASFHLLGEGEPERVRALETTHELFAALARPVALGRAFGAEEDRPGGASVAVISHRLWQRRWGGDPGLVGRAISLSGEPYEVIGVLPPGWYLHDRDVFVPLRLDYQSASRGVRGLVVFARLAPGVTLEQARAETATVAARLAADHPKTNTGWSTVILDYRELMVGNLRPALLTLWAAVGAVLLIACANAIGLTLLRVAARERELALRHALGAGRGALLRAGLAESVLIAAVAGALGVVLAGWLTRALLALYGTALPRADNVAVDPAVAAYAIALALLIGLVLGLVPAVRAMRPDLRAVLVDGGSGATGSRRRARVRRALMVAEVALACALLIAAGLLIRSLRGRLAVDPGFDPAGALTAAVELPPSRYGDEAQRAGFYRRLGPRLAAAPGVERAGIGSALPLVGGYVWEIFVEGRPKPPLNQAPIVDTVAIDPGFLAAVGVPVLRGRGFEPGDDLGRARVALLNETAAERLFPAGEGPLGARVTIVDPPWDEDSWWTIVGVVGNVQLRPELGAPIGPALWLPIQQYPLPAAHVVLAGNGDAPLAMAPPLRAALAELDPALPMIGVRPLGEVLDDALAPARFNAVLATVLAVLALFLAAVGIYGVVGYAVAARRREVGLRQALGAAPRAVLRMILLQSLRPIALGIALGLVLGAFATRYLRDLLFDVPSSDPATYLAVTALLMAVALAACTLPALRAARLRPWDVLREP